VHAVEFIDQLEDGASAETVDLLDVTPALKPPLRLILEAFADIYSVTSLQSTRPVAARQRRRVFYFWHGSSRCLRAVVPTRPCRQPSLDLVLEPADRIRAKLDRSREQPPAHLPPPRSSAGMRFLLHLRLADHPAACNFNVHFHLGYCRCFAHGNAACFARLLNSRVLSAAFKVESGFLEPRSLQPTQSSISLPQRIRSQILANAKGFEACHFKPDERAAGRSSCPEVSGGHGPSQDLRPNLKDSDQGVVLAAVRLLLHT
jgi:hypothetical protein